MAEREARLKRLEEQKKKNDRLRKLNEMSAKNLEKKRELESAGLLSSGRGSSSVWPAEESPVDDSP